MTAACLCSRQLITHIRCYVGCATVRHCSYYFIGPWAKVAVRTQPYQIGHSSLDIFLPEAPVSQALIWRSLEAIPLSATQWARLELTLLILHIVFFMDRLCNLRFFRTVTLPPDIFCFCDSDGVDCLTLKYQTTHPAYIGHS